MLGIEDGLDSSEDQSNPDKTFNGSMTLYANKTDFSFLQKTFRPLGSVLASPLGSPMDPVKSAAGRNHDLTDLLEAKRKMSKFSLPFTMRTLEAGLLRPEDLPLDKLKFLPAGGALLISNPMDLSKKGKKKKGSRSKSAVV